MIDFRNLPELDIPPETDDYRMAEMMISDIRGCHPECRIIYLAKWAARLRVTYVNVGKELAGPA